MIPKIIHQLWIGPKIPPSNFMDTWKTKHPEFEYIRWNEEEFKKRNIHFSCQNRIDDMEEINGKADIMRWEILYHYGGIFLDADSICVEPLNEVITETKAFAIWENEQCRKGLIAPGAMGFPPRHPLVKDCILWIQRNDVHVKRTKKRAWQTVGPGLVTQMYNNNKYKDISILPSYFFLPQHYTGLEYRGHGKIFSHQEWGSTKKNYDSMNDLDMPPNFLPPLKSDPYKSISILVSSYNTKMDHIQQCLESIKHSIGDFHMEVVWINDGSDAFHTELLKKALEFFERSTRFTKVIYSENKGNKGIGYTLNRGIHMCNNEIIIKMDSDDIMTSNRIQKQIDYMLSNPNVNICGAQIQMFRDTDKKVTGVSNHKSITWEQYQATPSHWFINHPTVCYRKSAVIEVGNYNDTLRDKHGNDDLSHDFELELRMLKKYGYVHNLEESLVNYRLHDKQVTYRGGKGGKQFWDGIRNDIVKSVI